MGVYTSNNFPPTPGDQAAWPNSVGGRIMAALPGNNATTAAHMTAIIAQFQNFNWTWNPAISGRSAECGRQLLDRPFNAIGSGECAWLAHALHQLLAAPPPYGFGVAGAVTAIYSGNGINDGNGFISNHVGLIHNLPANISAIGAPVLSNSYKWGDHVVVNYLGQYWDPSYNTVYANLQDMATHTITAMPISAIPGGPGMNFDIALDCTPVLGGAHIWFRNKQPWEVNEVGAWLGPTAARTNPPPRPPQNAGYCIIL